ncbi:DUF1566 domain-containing protein, partial [candidate division KSB3 bacterium]|nr:DUF1566 domain-containing protein [candidate division KSB3 bacterium]MBD3325421.1 DUF1566 domain-containing protein [candidate division KSB3 bacterium]
VREVFQLDENWRPLQYIQNDFEDQGEVVVDHATGLMWQKSGSDIWLSYQKAETYIKILNQESFVNYNDWRLSTVEELVSLLESEKQPNDLYINSIFDKKQWWCWSADKHSTGAAWLVSFHDGGVGWSKFDSSLVYVRAVRSTN